MLAIQIPNTYQPERQYILSVLLEEFLGLEVLIQIVDIHRTLSIGDDDRQLLISDKLFSTPFEQWLQPTSLPQQPLKIWNLATTPLRAITVEPRLPIIYGDDPENPDFFRQSETEIYLGLDIFGSAFFMLTRYEEVIKTERDQHDRFPAKASLAYQEKFLDRPIINEYLEVLWVCLKQLWPKLERKPRQFKVCVSHDVDVPFRYLLSGMSSLLRRWSGDIIKRRSFHQFLETASQWARVKAGYLEADPCNTFDLIMDISEVHNIKSAFYFITADSGGELKRYDINHPLIRQLMRKIHLRGHEIGIHPSYNTYQNSKQTCKEFEILKQVCHEEKIEQAHWGGRQHYLRWETPTTLQNWEKAGLDYDSTLGFADLPGFRCGICYEFSTFNVLERTALKLRERPLIVMEHTVLGDHYLGLNVENPIAHKIMLRYREACEIFNGQFTLLWHNNHLTESSEVQLYRQIIDSPN
jgi:hypothetical protein